MKHIDTLYLYRVCFDFNDYSNILHELNEYTDLNGCKFLGRSNGRLWRDLGFCRVGVMDFYEAERANTYPFLIQYSWGYLFNLTKKQKISQIISLIRLPLGGNLNNYKIQRVDFTITKKGFPILPHAVTPFRKKTIMSDGSDNVETVYFGRRSTGLVYRVYNKSKEIETKKDFEKIEEYAQEFNGYHALTVFEMEFRRKYFTQKIKNYRDTLEGLTQIFSLFQLTASKISHFYPTQENLKHFDSNHYDRIFYAFNLGDLIAEEVISGEASIVIQKKRQTSKPSFELLASTIFKLVKNYSEKVEFVDFDDVIHRVIELHKLTQ